MKRLTSLESKIHQSVGRASMCWENVGGAGTFDEKQAREVAAELHAYIQMNTYPKPKGLLKKWLYWLKTAVFGALVYLPHYLFGAFMVWAAVWMFCGKSFEVTYWQAFGFYWLLRIIRVEWGRPTDKHNKILDKSNEKSTSNRN